MKTKKNIQSICQKYLKRNFELLLIREKGIRDYVLLKDFNTFMHDHTLCPKIKYFDVIAYRLLVQQKN